MINRFLWGVGLASITWTALQAAGDPNFVDNHFSGSGNCALCHDGIADPQGNDISIVKNWSATMMANSSRDPYWKAKVAAELHRNPQLTDAINDKCSRCHAPMANDAAKKDGAPVKILDTGFLDPANSYYNHAQEGVSCTLCHQISDTATFGTLEGSSGHYEINPAGAAGVSRAIYGPFMSPLTGPMQNKVSFTPQYSAHISDSALCASCHNLKTPYIDANGAVVSTTLDTEFPEQMVFSEWQNSIYSVVGGADEQSCQSCHMPQVEGDVKISNRPANQIQPRAGFSKHVFIGANTVMLDLLERNRTELGVTSTGFATSIANTRVLLESAATLEVLSQQLVGTELKVVLKVNNESGHKLPTSYPSRRAFLHVTVADAAGNTLFESGKLNADGSIVGNDADVDFTTLEPHYTEITTEDQVQIYEPIMANSDGGVTHTLLRAGDYLKDNRITPKGFDKLQVGSDIAVKGGAATDADFNLGSDTITYRVDVGNATDLVITAELVYQPLAYGHLQDLFADAAVLPEVADFKRMFEDSNTLRAERLAWVATTLGAGVLPDAPAASTPVTEPATLVTTGGNGNGNGGALGIVWLWLLSLLAAGRSLLRRR